MIYINCQAHRGQTIAHIDRDETGLLHVFVYAIDEVRSEWGRFELRKGSMPLEFLGADWF